MPKRPAVSPKRPAVSLKCPAVSPQTARSAAADWFAGDAGRWIIAEERRVCRDITRDIFGLYGAQCGAVDRPLLAGSPVRHHILVARDGGGVRADWRELPFAANSLDLLILAHALEAAADARAVLREAVRALRPEGRLVIIGFNPWSLLALSRKTPWRRRWLSVARVKDWLGLLNMQPVGGDYAGFLPPWDLPEKWRPMWLESTGRRWWPLAGGVFFLHTVKKQYGVRLVMPKRFAPPLKKGLAGAGAEKRIQ